MINCLTEPMGSELRSGIIMWAFFSGSGVQQSFRVLPNIPPKPTKIPMYIGDTLDLMF